MRNIAEAADVIKIVVGGDRDGRKHARCCGGREAAQEVSAIQERALRGLANNRRLPGVLLFLDLDDRRFRAGLSGQLRLLHGVIGNSLPPPPSLPRRARSVVVQRFFMRRHPFRRSRLWRWLPWRRPRRRTTDPRKEQQDERGNNVSHCRVPHGCALGPVTGRPLLI